jgi:hypothetical protein
MLVDKLIYTSHHKVEMEVAVAEQDQEEVVLLVEAEQLTLEPHILKEEMAAQQILQEQLIVELVDMPTLADQQTVLEAAEEL